MEPIYPTSFRKILSGLVLVVLVLTAPGARAEIVLTQSAQLESNQASSGFGASAAGVGDLNGDGFEDFVVGAPYYDSGDTNEGAVFVYLGSASGVPSGGPAVADAILEGDQAEAEFGFSVAGAGDVNGDGYDDLLIGAPRYEVGFEVNAEGAAFLFLGGPTGLASGGAASADTVIETDPGVSGRLGEAVAGAGDVNQDGYADIVIGAPLMCSLSGCVGVFPFPPDGTPNGKTFVFHGSASGIASAVASAADAVLEGAVPGIYGAANHVGLGGSVAGAGDVNGDDYDDVIVAFSAHDPDGAAYVFHGGPSGVGSRTTAAADAAVLGSDEFDYPRPTSVSGAGDRDGDGFDDVAVGSSTPGLDASMEFRHGSAMGIASGTRAVADLTVVNLNNILAFSESLVKLGDLDRDGYADMLVGEPDPGGFGFGEHGSAYVFAGGPTDGLPGPESISITGADLVVAQSQSMDRFGASVAAADLNGDGCPDAVIGADRYDAGEADEGAAFVYLGTCPPKVPAAGLFGWGLLSALLAAAGLRGLRARAGRRCGRTASAGRRAGSRRPDRA